MPGTGSPVHRLLNHFRKPVQQRNLSVHARTERDVLDGGWIAECLELPGCVAQGNTEREAVEHLIEVITDVLALRMAEQIPVANEASEAGKPRSFDLCLA